MKIGIDVSQIIYGTGVSNYTKNLVTSLIAQDDANQYVLFGSSLRQFGQFSKLIPSKTNITAKFYPFPPRVLDLIWNQLHIIPVENLIGPVDIFHSSDWTQPPTKRAGKITTIHDLSPLVVPELTPPSTLKTHRRRLQWVKKEADLVIAVSEATKSDIVKYLSIPPERIRVIHEAPDPVFSPVGNTQVVQVKKKYDLSGQYFLFVGVGMRKNLAMARKVIIEKFKDYQLVVVGANIEERQPSTIFLNNVSAADLATLYAGAQALLYISFYEGFGLPLLEAMAVGCPVVASDINVLAEISGGAAVLVDSYDEDSIASGARKAIDCKDELIKKGFDRAKQFSWQVSAWQTLQAYTEVFQGGS
ncbi:glycosyltransferase family 4 protein [Candidatus Daviesbacteria bacterium]|nr:glycosyltransferase family 4 protein [Candidatus Daviesbacteria bacterium]